MAASLRLADAYTELKNDSLFAKSVSAANLVHVVLYANLVRQVAGLDAATAVAGVGRPMFVSLIERTMYEVWHAMLAIAYINDGTNNSASLAKRFWDHACFQFSEKGKELLPLAVTKARGQGLDSLAIELSEQSRIDDWENAAAGSGFTKPGQAWHPFQGKDSGMKALHEALWPANGNRVFPMRIYGSTRDEWDDMHRLAWKYNSDDVHSGGAGLERFIRKDSPALVDDSRRFEAAGLNVCKCLADSSVAILTDTVGIFDRWVEIRKKPQMRLARRVALV